jgi:hypothetical protein
MDFHLDFSKETPESIARLKAQLIEYVVMMDGLRVIESGMLAIDPGYKSQLTDEALYYEAVCRLLCSEPFHGRAVAA